MVEWTRTPNNEALLPYFLETRNLIEEVRKFSLLNLAVVILEAVVACASQ